MMPIAFPCSSSSSIIVSTSKHSSRMYRLIRSYAAVSNQVPNKTCNLTRTEKFRASSRRYISTTSSLRRNLSSSAASATVSSSSSSTASSFWNVVQDNGIDRRKLEELARERPTPLKLADIYKFGACTTPQQRIRNAQFLYRELPIRIAHRIVDLLTLPHGLSEAVAIQQVAIQYLQYLRDFEDFLIPQTIEDEIIFTDFLATLVLDRGQIPNAIAAGVQEWRSFSSSQNKRSDIHRLHEMDDALYRFFTARVGLRFLTEHHVLSSTNTQSADALWNVISMFPDDRKGDHNMRGVIQPNVDVAEEVHKVADIVKRQTAEYYQGLCPKIDIVDCKKSPVSDGEFTHVPHHLHYMFYELLKNACRASIRKYHAQLQLHLQQQQPQTGTLNKVNSYLSAAKSLEPEIPPIRVIIVMGAEDVTIKVADRGGGIPRSLMTTIWQFAHSTAAVDELDTAFGQDGLTGAKIRGFGLPLARIYARYFGGELTLKSTEGYGLDAYLHIPRLGNCCENLPLRVRDSPGEHDSIPNFSASPL